MVVNDVVTMKWNETKSDMSLFSIITNFYKLGFVSIGGLKDACKHKIVEIRNPK